MRTYYLLTLTFFLTGVALCGAPAAAQTTVVAGGPNDAAPDERATYDRNMLYAEVGGAAGLYSINYERWLNDRWSVRVGGTWHRLGLVGEPVEMMGPVFGASRRLLSWGVMHVESGAAMHPILAKGTYDCFLRCSTEEAEAREGEPFTKVLLLASPSVGMRLQRARGGPVFRYSQMALLGVNPGDGSTVAAAWGGVSLGWSF